MKPRILAILAFAAGAASLSATAQESGLQKDAPSAARVLAGVREYPEPVVEALVTLAQNPAWLDKAVTKIRANQDPLAGADASMPEAVRAALKTLAPTPEAIMLAGARREELNLLRDMRQEAPQGADVRVRQLRADYATAKREAVVRWQQTLQGNEEALNAYRDLLMQFTEELRKQVPNFAAVEVTDRNYYLVCAPDEVVMGFAQEKKAQEVLWKLMTEWYDRYGAEPIDQQLLRGVGGIGPSRAENALIDEPAERRKAMFRADDGKMGDSLGLVPIALQPLADQPSEARAAFAIAEHERLWARLPAAEQNVAAGDVANGYDGADMKIEPPQPTQPGAPGADVVVTPARPDMIIPPGGSSRWIDEEPLAVSRGYDGEVVPATVGGVEIVDGATEVVVESAPTVVYEDYYAPVYVSRPYYSYYPYYGGYCYPGWSFGFSFGYYGGYGGCYPYSYYGHGYHGYYGHHGHGYYGHHHGHGYHGYYGHRHYGHAGSHYKGYGYGGYGGYRGWNGRPRPTPYNGNYADGRRGGLSQGQRFSNDSAIARNGRGGAGRGSSALGRGGSMNRGDSINRGGSGFGRGDSLGRGGSAIGRDAAGLSPRTITRPNGGSGGDGVRPGGSGSSIGRNPGSISRGDGIRRTQPSSVRPNSQRGTPRSGGMQQAPTRSLGPRSVGPSRSGSGIGSLRGRSMQTSPAPRSSFNRSSVFRGGGGGMSRQSMSRGGGGGMSRPSMSRGGGGMRGGGGGMRGGGGRR